jgi:hypothetical protein
MKPGGFCAGFEGKSTRERRSRGQAILALGISGDPIAEDRRDDLQQRRSDAGQVPVVPQVETKDFRPVRTDPIAVPTGRRLRLAMASWATTPAVTSAEVLATGRAAK